MREGALTRTQKEQARKEVNKHGQLKVTLQERGWGLNVLTLHSLFPPTDLKGSPLAKLNRKLEVRSTFTQSTRSALEGRTGRESRRVNLAEQTESI